MSFKKKTLKCHFISTLLILYYTALYGILKGSLNYELNMQIFSLAKTWTRCLLECFGTLA